MTEITKHDSQKPVALPSSGEGFSRPSTADFVNVVSSCIQGNEERQIISWIKRYTNASTNFFELVASRSLPQKGQYYNNKKISASAYYYTHSLICDDNDLKLLENALKDPGVIDPIKISIAKHHKNFSADFVRLIVADPEVGERIRLALCQKHDLDFPMSLSQDDANDEVRKNIDDDLCSLTVPLSLWLARNPHFSRFLNNFSLIQCWSYPEIDALGRGKTHLAALHQTAYCHDRMEQGVRRTVVSIKDDPDVIPALKLRVCQEYKVT